MEKRLETEIELNGKPEKVVIEQVEIDPQPPFEYWVWVIFNGYKEERPTAIIKFDYQMEHPGAGMNMKMKPEYPDKYHFDSDWEVRVAKAIIANFHKESYYAL